MIPCLFDSGLTTAPVNGALGIGKLSDCISCLITREINGQYELEMVYPVAGLHYAELELRRLLWVKPDQYTDPQLFRIWKITRPMLGAVTVCARHIAYDLQGYVCAPFSFTAENIGDALLGIYDNTFPADGPISVTTSRTTTGRFTVSVPTAVWNLLGGQEGSLLDAYGGEWDFDNFTVESKNRLGADRGFVIRYGKNLKTLQQDENCAAVYTGVYPYWMGADGNIVVLPEQVVNAPGTFDFSRYYPLDLSDRWQEAPDEATLRAAAESYIVSNEIGVPEVSIDVDFVALWQTEDYKGLAPLEKVAIGDTVSVVFERLGVDATARVVGVTYDCLLDRYNTITVGRVKQNLPSIIARQEKALEEKPTKGLVEQIAENLGKAMLGVHGGAVRLLDTNGDGLPDELYIADNENEALATKVWRFNYEGWAASTTGYAGPYIMGATLDDGILANAITAAQLTAGTIRSADGETVNIDLDNGIVRLNVGSNGYFQLNGYNLDDYFNISLDENNRVVVRIGSSDNGIVLKQMNDRIAFCDSDGTELAYWNNNSFIIAQLQIFQLGTGFAMVAQENGSVSVVYPE